MQKNNFDFIRFILAFTVVLAHIVILSQSSVLKPLGRYFDSYVAVTGFFVISGFLVTKSYIRTNNIKQYFIKRANRILPAYLFTIFISAVFLSFVSAKGLSGFFFSTDLYKYLFYNIIFLNFLHPCLPGVFINNYLCAVNGALWTIKVEVGFYITIPLIILLIQKTNKRLAVLVFIYILSVLYKVILSYLYLKTGNNLFDTLDHQLPSFLCYFACGIAMHYYLPIFLKYKHRLAAMAIVLCVIEYFFSLEIFKPLTLTIIIFYVFYGFRFLNNFGKNGDISYGIYIYHFPIIQLFVSLGFFTNEPYISAICVIITVIISGILSWHLLEKRFLHREVTG